MISFTSTRSLFGLMSRQFQFSKHCLSSVNNQLALLHRSRLLWSNHPIEIKMPSLSPTMTEGTIVKWLKKEGDTIEPGDVLCEIQTDKAVVGFETEEEGVLEKILIPEDTKNVKLGEIIGIIIAEGEATSIPIPPPKIVEDKPKDAIINKNDKFDPHRLIGPSVKKLLQEYDIELSSVPSSGPMHNLLKGDILQYIKEKNLKKAVKVADKPKAKKVAITKIESKSGTHVDIPISITETKTAQEMIQSKRSIPHGYMSTDCKIDKVLDFKKKFEKDGTSVSLNEFIIRGVATALKQVPKMKAIRHNGQLKTADSVNISVSNYNDGKYDISVIQNAENLNVQSISELIKASHSSDSNFASANGTFHITNLGNFGISEFTEVIAPAGVATMAVGGVRYIFEEEKPVKKMRVTISFDNSLISDNEAGEFLEIFKLCLENPLHSMCLN